MSSTQTHSDAATERSRPTADPMRLEVVVVEPTGVDALALLLRETSEHHDRFEKAAAPHDWWDWYAAYLTARDQGLAPDEADAAADRYMAEAKNVVVGAS